MIRYLIPNIVTSLNLYCGCGVIFYALTGNLTFSAQLVFIAMIVDFWDGRIARLMNCTSRIGMYLDTVADCVSFAFAPMVLAYCSTPSALRNYFIFAYFLYAMCGCYRLIRYTRGTKGRRKIAGIFDGLPIPAAAGTVMSFLLLYIHLPTSGSLSLVIISTFLTAFLMISYVPYRHSGRILACMPKAARVSLYVASIVLLLFNYYFMAFIVFFILYLILGVVRKKEYEALLQSPD